MRLHQKCSFVGLVTAMIYMHVAVSNKLNRNVRNAWICGTCGKIFAPFSCHICLFQN